MFYSVSEFKLFELVSLSCGIVVFRNFTARPNSLILWTVQIVTAQVPGDGESHF